MANSLSEGFARITYTGLSGIHHQMLPVNFSGTPVAGVEPTFTTKIAGTVAAETAISDWLDVFRAAFNTATLFGLVEIYAVNPTTEERTFIYGFDASRAGSSGDPSVQYSMGTMTFKTIGGGLLKIVAMEPVLGVNTKLYPPFFLGGILDDIQAFVVDGDSFIIGRDDDYSFAPISWTTKTSDALRKRVGLS